MTTNPEPTYLLIRETDYTYDDYEELVSAYTAYAYDAAGRLIEKIALAQAAHPDLDAWVTAWAEQHYGGE